MNTPCAHERKKLSSPDKKNLIKIYNKEFEVYDVKRSFYEKGYGGYRERKLLTLFCRGPRILNIACGTGRLLPFLAGIANEVVGFDFSRNMLKVARKKIQNYNNIHLIVADAEFLPFRERIFDEIVCSRAFKFFPNPRKMLIEGWEVLKVGGISIVSIETSEPLWIRIGYRLKIPYMGSRFEWRYRVREIYHLFKDANYKVLTIRCIIYFGKTIYQIMDKYFRPILKLLELIDTYNKIGRNVMFVGIKLDCAKHRERYETTPPE